MLNSIDLTEITNEWPGSQPELKTAFLELVKEMEDGDGTELELISRPGITYSVRANVPSPERDRPLYVMADVIVSDSEPWFLSVCFFADEITDPDELGDEVPGGLFDQDACCFDLDDGEDKEMADYLKERISEAHENALA